MRQSAPALSRWAGYEFEVMPFPTAEDVWRRLLAEPATYIMAYPTASGHWMPLYIGKSKSVASRIRYHSRWVDAWAHAQTEAESVVYLHVRGFNDPADLPGFEQMLIHSYNPPLNQRLKSRFWYDLEPAVGPPLQECRAVQPFMALRHSTIRYRLNGSL